MNDFIAMLIFLAFCCVLIMVGPWIVSREKGEKNE
jgi:hypothetical protein